MLDIKIDVKRLENELKKLSTWDDWSKIEDEIFKLDQWKESEIDTLEIDLKRPPIIMDGVIWESTTTSYEISPEIYHLHEKTRWEVFAKLEPEADKDNKNHPERYGKWCVYCKRWTREYLKANCPQCRKELLPLPLNED